MELKIKIDVEKIKEANGTKADAFFKYLKNVAKNKTIVLLKGVKTDDFWKCDVYECSIPTSHFTSILLPATGDKNPAESSLCVHLTDKLLSTFVDGAEFTFKDTEVSIKIGSSRVRETYHETKESLEDQLEEFLTLLEADSTIKTKLVIESGSELTSVLKEISSAPDGSIFINKNSVTVWNDSIFYRADTKDNFEGDELYINMYTANKLLSALEYCVKVELTIDELHSVITGYDNDGQVIIKNVAAIFDTDFENPTDEDLASITPSGDSVVSVDLDLSDFLETVGNQMNLISTFIQKKNLEGSLYKNGDGLSLKLSKSDNGENTFLNMNIGAIADPEPADDVFTEFDTIVPISLIKSLMIENQSLRITYDPNSEAAVLFESGEHRVLSGQR